MAIKRHRPGWRVLLGAAIAFGALGLVVGMRGIFAPPPTSSPLARIGHALERSTLQGDARDWALLREDVLAVRQSLDGDLEGAFNIVVALRGLDSGGLPDWHAAEQLCQELSWPRCDREALERLRRRSLP